MRLESAVFSFKRSAEIFRLRKDLMYFLFKLLDASLLFPVFYFCNYYRSCNVRSFEVVNIASVDTGSLLIFC
jgi:hypothetical protein